MPLVPSQSLNLSTITLFQILVLLLLLDVTKQASALQCYHCVCHNDCTKNPNMTRQCPSEFNACNTKTGPGNQVMKLCANEQDSGGAMEVKGQKNDYCKTDLCNSMEVTLVTDSKNSGNGLMDITAWRNNTTFLIVTMLVAATAKSLAF